MAFWERGGRKFVVWFLSCLLTAMWSCGAKIHYCQLLAGMEMLSDGATYRAELVFKNKENSV